MTKSPNRQKAVSPQFWMLASFLVFVFLFGGASRLDVQSLLILRPLSILACAAALLTLTRSHVADHRLLTVGIAASFFLALSHLIPLPPMIWRALPGRELIVEIDRAAGLGDVWRPLTLTPANGWHSLVAMCAPLATILLGVQLSRDELSRLLPLILGLGILSGLIGVQQAIGDPNGPLYFYEITSNGWAVGLFANRTNAAVFLACLLPMFATHASISTGTVDRQRLQGLLAAAACIAIAPLILVTGSRLGLFLGIAGLASAGLLYRKPEMGRVVRRSGRNWQVAAGPLLASVAIVCLGSMTFILSRAEAVDRLFRPSSEETGRLEIWNAAISATMSYFPVGSGLGSVVEVLMTRETDESLNSTYINHVHNDWIELAMTMGLPGLLILLTALILFARRAVDLWRTGDSSRRAVKLGKMAAVILLFLAIASVTDYPLRTPSLSCFAALCILWFSSWRLAQNDANEGCT